MEIDEELPSFSSNSIDISANTDLHFIGNKLQSIQLDNETEMVDIGDDCGLGASKNIKTSETIIKAEELPESVKTFHQFQKEREDTTFSRNCLFCKKHFTGNRSLLLNHLTEQHNFFLGQPDNLVFINEFLDILEDMLNKLQCLYCEKIFKDWSALKEHMRKKMHKGINPNNKSFDRFYMLNYLNKFSRTDSVGYDADEEREIEMEPAAESIICLYCDCKYSDFDEVMYHLKVVHGFDFRSIKKEFKLCFYSQVKLINYIRKKVSLNECTVCDAPFRSQEALFQHMTALCHINMLPPQEKWDQPEYFFSTFENDYLLCGLHLEDDEEESDPSVEIISEDIVIPAKSVLRDENLRRELLL